MGSYSSWIKKCRNTNKKWQQAVSSNTTKTWSSATITSPKISIGEVEDLEGEIKKIREDIRVIKEFLSEDDVEKKEKLKEQIKKSLIKEVVKGL